MHNIKFFDSLTHIKKDETWYNTDKRASFKNLKKYHEAGSITKAVVATMPDDDYDYIGQKISKDLSFCSFVFSIKKEWLKYSDLELKNIFLTLKRKYGAVGIKIHPRFSEIDIQSDQVIRLAQLAAKLGLIVYICTILRKPVGPTPYSIHYYLAKICENCPSTNFVFLHGGYTDLFSTGEMVRDYPNAILDLSFTFMRFRKSSLALDVGYLFETLDRKLTIGTDYPEYTPEELKNELDKYVFSRNELSLTREKIENVLYHNLNNLLLTYE